ncbi:MAG: MFS transporter, partial [Alphaproteobacteria bacterium]
MSTTEPERRGRRREGPAAALPRGVWVLGFVSLLMDTSSEMIHALLPVFLVGTLGASTAVVGLVEGLGEATASITKLFSGWLSDRLGRRKPLVLAGYALAALSKPLFALAPSAGWVLGARLSDRLGKGIRGAPRDALLADLTPPEARGRAYSLRQALDTVGAFAGPIVAMVLLSLLAGDMRAVFWAAGIPAAAAVLLIVIAVPEPPRPEAPATPALPPSWRDATRLGLRFWAVAGLAVAMVFARFTEAFLVLRASGAGLSLGLVPLVYVILNVVYSASAYPVGALADRIGPRGLLAFGFVVIALGDLILALGHGLTPILVAVALWGLHMGLTQGLLSAEVSRAVPAPVRGTAFGVYHLVTGL